MREYSRRVFAVLGFAVLVATGLLTSHPTMAAPRVLSAADAYNQARSGKILLLDIRHPEEWRDTGVGEGAYPLSLHQKGFLRKLRSLTGGDTSKPIALICATGSRSQYLQRELLKRGYQTVIDVPEGMEGNRKGRGWIKLGLPVKKLTH